MKLLIHFFLQNQLAINDIDLIEYSRKSDFSPSLHSRRAFRKPSFHPSNFPPAVDFKIESKPRKARSLPLFSFFFSFPLFLSAPLEITGAHASLLYRRVESGAISRMRCRLHSARRKPPSFLTRFLVENPIDRASHFSTRIELEEYKKVEIS